MDEGRLRRKEDESEIGYKARLYRDKLELGLNNKEINEIINKELNISLAESSNRCTASAYNQGWNEAIEKYANENSDENYLKELEEKKLEIEKLKIQYQDQKREYRNYLRADARFEHLKDTILNEIERLNDVNPIIKYNDNFNKEYNNEAVLIASDWHTGAKFDNYFGKYNYEIQKQRVSELLNKTIKYCKDNEVKTLHLELLGDMLSGAIHISSKVESEEDVVSQLMYLLDLLEDFINELANNIENVKIYTGVGNHSRIYDFDKNQEGENFERLIPYSLSKRFEQISNVEVMSDCNIDDHIVLFNVKGNNIIGIHGDLDKPNKVVDDMIKMLKTIPDEVHLGHYHTDIEKTEYDIELIVNGCLQGTDSYAKRIRKSGQPMQKLRIYDNDGCLLEYKIKL